MNRPEGSIRLPTKVRRLVAVEVTFLPASYRSSSDDAGLTHEWWAL